MSHKSNPPRQSAVARKRKPVTAHNDRASVGHGIGSRRKTATDPQNGRCNDRSRPVTSSG
jgi:hypothetical protein